MNLSVKWLSDYVKIDIPPRAFSEAMTMSGSKVEGYEREGADITGVVTGRVLSIDPHPDAEHLLVCRVDVAGEKPLQIVTGAGNLKIGDMVPVATDGATLPGTCIRAAALRGVQSEGMLCSLSELGLTRGDFPDADENGIFVITEPCKPGEDIHSAIGLDDTVFEFEITPNRPDCLSVVGLAREAAVTFGVAFSPAVPRVRGSGGRIADYLSVEVLNPRLCPRYMARVVRNVRIGPSPLWLRQRLRASGVRPINNIVDITNYVMLEYGQPLHAFDLRHVQENRIVVRNALPGESIVTLDGVIRPLAPDMLVIADGQKPSAVAGIMGGEYSGIAEDTQTVVFESANFLGTATRSTSRRLGLRTESSSRFEKGLDPQNCEPAVQRACELVELLDAGDVVDGVIDVNHSAKAPTRVPFDPEWINRFLGIELPPARMEEILNSLGFALENGQVVVPSFRGDVELKADIAEEIARFYGYDNIPAAPLCGVSEGRYTARQKLENRAVACLTAQGLNEVVTYTFVSPKYYDKINLPADSPLRRSVVIANPLGEDTSLMRTTALPLMMEVVARNLNNRMLSGAFFELAKEFIPGESADVLPLERQRVILGLYGADADFYLLKGVAENLLDRLGVADYDFAACGNHHALHPGRTAQLTIGGRPAGVIGEAHPSVCKNYGLTAKVLLGDLDWELICAHAGLERTYTPLPRFPASARDIALVCDEALPVRRIERIIQESIPDILESLTLFDVYRGEQIPCGKKSVAYTLVFRSPDSTLTDETVDAALRRALEALSAQGISLRG
jgi:phenylalanyl-tRNA synthetase beta chain